MRHSGLRSVLSWLFAPIQAVWLYLTSICTTCERSERLRNLEKSLESANSYSEWCTLANELEDLRGSSKWRLDPKHESYDHRVVSSHLTLLRSARLDGNIWTLVMLVRRGLSRNFAGIGADDLFLHSLVGTKHLIEEYVEEVDGALRDIFSSSALPLSERIELCANMRRVYGRTALMLSGGATLGMYHLGVLKALHEHKLLPRIFSGASAGSLMASLVCCKTDEELPAMFDPANINLDAIERRGEGTAGRRAKRLLKTGYLFDISVLQECLRENAGDLTFLEAYNRTRRVLNITVSATSAVEMPRLLNYLTAPHVLVWSAASASCAIPGLYEPVPLLAKNKRGEIVPWNPNGPPWVDGSVQSDVPMARLSEMFNVNHFIVSQVNPHLAPFIANRPAPPTRRGRFWDKLLALTRNEISHLIFLLLDFNVLSSKFSKILSWIRALLDQKYTGDITIVPDVALTDYASIMDNPSVVSVRQKAKKMERATWAQLPILKMHCRIEHTLDSMLYNLRVELLSSIGRPYKATDFALNVPVGIDTDGEDGSDEGSDGKLKPMTVQRSQSISASMWMKK